MAGYVWGAKRDLRGGVKIPEVVGLRLSLADEEEWAEYEAKNTRAGEMYYAEQAGEFDGGWSLAAIAAMVKRRQAVLRKEGKQ